jgi:ABC-type branched-subunit amino acid transport system substrate-binding protein
MVPLLGAVGVIFGVLNTDIAKMGVKVVFIFDHGEYSSSGAGHPGRDFFEGWRKGKADFETMLQRMSVEIEDEDDKGDEYVAKRAAEKLANDSRVVAVVGHLSSSIMAVTLQTYLDKNVPLIMPVPTNPEFTDRAAKQGHFNVLRMPPTDREQARVAVDFAISTLHSHRIAIIKDADNFNYSQNLATEFTKRLRILHAASDNGAAIVFQSTIGGSAASNSLASSLKALAVDTIFLPGTTDNALTFIETLLPVAYPPASDPGPLPRIVMTDGVLVADFLNRLSAVPAELYVSFPLSHDGQFYTNVRNGSNQRSGAGSICSRDTRTSYCPYGYDSVFLVHELLERTLLGFFSRHLLNFGQADVLKTIKNLPELPGAYADYGFVKKGDTNTGDTYNPAFQFTMRKANQKTKQFELN